MADATTQPQPKVRPKKQAVLLIHGIGEQRPMATLWRLVDLVWLKSAHADENRRVYSEPDEISGVFELRRISTGPNSDGKRTDFFEYYWAHLMDGNEWGDVFAWLRRLAMRPKDAMPETLRRPWRALHLGAAFIILFLLLMLSTAATAGAQGQFGWFVLIFMTVLAALAMLSVVNQMFLSPVLGDAARYFRPSPKNVPCRQAIREQGLKLLEALHASGKYDRIVLVGHSLGGVIAYELAILMWGKRNRLMDRNGRVQDAIAAAEDAARALEVNQDAATQARWRLAQTDVFEALRGEQDEHGRPLWLISDLVTLGCPLAHAPTLMADTHDDFDQALRRREMSTCPPQFEDFANSARRFSYCRRPGDAGDGEAGPRAPHNSAVFAAARWTNLYFPMRTAFRGDFIGGPTEPVFGAGVRDIAVRAPHEHVLVPHMDYFETDADPLSPDDDPNLADHRAALREALALEGARAPQPALPASLP